MWPWTFLVDSDYQSEFALCNVREYTQAVHKGTHACAFDLAASFWQVALKNVNFVMTAEDGKRYRVERMPFGIDCASEIMQIIVEELGKIACTRAGLPLNAVHLFVHIDNIMCVGTEEDVRKWRKHFLAACSSYGVTLNDEPENNKVSQSVEFAGICYCFKPDEKYVKPRQSFIDAVPTRKDATRSFVELESCVGKLLYGLAIRQKRAHQYHHFIEWWRQQLSRLNRNPADWQKPVHFPESSSNKNGRPVADALEAMIQEVKSPSPARVHKTPVIKPGDKINLDDESLMVLVVDATLYGYGGVLYEKGEVAAAFGGSFETKASSMGTAEIAGALAMIRHFAQRLQGRKFVLITDNTSCEYGVRNGKSRHLAMDRAAHTIHCLLCDIGAEVIVGHVSTDKNVADAVSRGKELDPALHEKSEEAAACALQTLEILGATRVGGLLKEVLSKALG